MSHLGEDRAEVVQPMHGLDVDVEVCVEVPPGTDVCDHLRRARTLPPGGGRCSPQSGVVGCDFVPVVRGVSTGDDRPCARVGGRFAGEVPGIEFRDGGVEVVEVEHDDAPRSVRRR